MIWGLTSVVLWAQGPCTSSRIVYRKPLSSFLSNGWLIDWLTDWLLSVCSVCSTRFWIDCSLCAAPVCEQQERGQEAFILFSFEWLIDWLMDWLTSVFNTRLWAARAWTRSLYPVSFKLLIGWLIDWPGVQHSFVSSKSLDKNPVSCFLSNEWLMVDRFIDWVDFCV